MPELPDVEAFRRYLTSTALHNEVTDVAVYSQQVLAEAAYAEAVRQGLVGRTLTGTRRHGKYLFVHLDDDRWLEMHFGMSGRLVYFKDAKDDPDDDRLRLAFANGYYLAYVAPRKLGEIALLEDPDVLIDEKALGPDVAAESFDREAFRELLADRRGMIKSALMDQQLMAGIGNVYSDEILFQAQVHPRSRVQALDGATLDRIYATLREVLEVATERLVRSEPFPEDYLTPRRDPNGHCPRCDAPLERVAVSGRTAYYCPNRQGAAPAR
jgi:formamidopyrimidine-DNA glycosylase